MSRPLTNSEIEAQVRAAYGPKLDGGEQLHLLVENALHSWAGRAIDPESVDPIILAEGARATKTYGGALRLAAGGFGPQVSMLARSLFEGMAIAHWAHANPEQAIDFFKKHGRHSELLWGDAFERANPDDPRTIDTGTEEERKGLADLFGKYGAGLWTGHRSLHDLLPEIEDQWEEGRSRDMLWWFFRVAHRDNNQILHSTALGLSAGIKRGTEEIRLDVGPSDHYLDRGLLGAWWSYVQMAGLLWDHFDIPDRAALDAATDTAGAAFEKTEAAT